MDTYLFDNETPRDTEGVLLIAVNLVVTCTKHVQTRCHVHDNSKGTCHETQEHCL